MDKLNTLISLNDAKKAIDELIVKLRHSSDEEKSCDSRKLLILVLSVIGAAAVVAAVAFAVYKHFSNEAADEFDEDLFDDEDEDESDDDADTEDDSE